MKWSAPIIAIVLLFIIQLAFADLDLSLGVPNLVLCYLAVLLLYRKLSEVLQLGVIAGLLLDYFSGYPDGVMLAGIIGALAAAYYLGNSVSSGRLSNFLVLFYFLFVSIFFALIVSVGIELLAIFDISGGVNWNNLLTFKLGSDVIFNLIFLYPMLWFYETQIRIQKVFSKKHEPI
jgi:hypothetical protein